MEEAIKRNQKIGLLYIDFEAQYKDTIDHVYEVYSMYKDMIDPHWVCVPMLLRNALTNYVPQWMCWDPDKKDLWIRDKPNNEFVKHEDDYPFCEPGMEFEEFTPLFGEWYGEHGPTAAFIGIRAQESLHRYCSIATWEKRDLMLGEKRWTTRISKNTYNVYPIYDWLTDDIWKYHAKNPDKPYNKVYDKMQMAGVKLSQQRLCQPFGDDQRRGLWLYHILEPETWAKLVARVNGANSGALYVQNSGNMTGYNKITKPEGHTWKSFCNLLLQTMPQKTREHYIFRFKKFIYSWHKRGYGKIPEEAPPELEAKCWAPSWRRMCKVLLRNDYWCKGLGMSQPKSEAYQKFKAIKAARKKDQEAAHA
jgi:predicted phosphoadenosine phosphosulfate sulfurtransferase